MVIINGKKEPKAEGMILANWLISQNYPQGRIAVEYNGDLIPKSTHESCVLTAGDCLEIVTFVGGG